MMSESGKSKQAIFDYLRVATALLCTVGFALSVYAFHVETTKEKDKEYKAMCDISEHMSCSAVFTSKYGKGFGLLGAVVGEDSILNQPNSLYGMVFYPLFAILGFLPSVAVTWACVVLSGLSNVCSVYLACILYFILHDFCVVCVSTYVVNAGLLACSCYKLKQLKRSSEKVD